MYAFQPNKTVQLWVREAHGDINEQFDFLDITLLPDLSYNRLWLLSQPFNVKPYLFFFPFFAALFYNIL